MSLTKSGRVNEFRVVIPAHIGSRRLPNKPLLKLTDKTLIEHVYQNAVSSGAEQVIVATDASQVADCVHAFGGNVYVTALAHSTGTDRIAETVKALAWEDECIVVNIQGDEPFIAADDVRRVADDLAASGAEIATLTLPLTRENVNDPNIVKVVRDRQNFALYFSRAAIPYYVNNARGYEDFSDGIKDTCLYYHHLGIYAYRCAYLARFTALPQTIPERVESLEQLRALVHGDRIHVGDATTKIALGINCEKDLQVAKKLLK